MLSIEFNDYNSITIINDNNGSKSRMFISEPYLFSRERWMKFRDSIINDKDDCLNFCQSNGEVSLKYKCSNNDSDGTIQYTVGKYGAGGDGYIEMSFQQNENFVDIINILIENDDIWKEIDDI